jgi:transposase-like protein
VAKTFAATTGTPFYRLRLAVDLLTIVVTLLRHGGPTQAIVAAFGLSERTVARWLQRAGQHAQHLHQHLVQQGHLDLQHVQADELWVKLVGRKVWQAMAIAVPSRLWLGGVSSAQHDRHLITALVQQMCASAVTLAILVCVDGLVSYVSAFRKGFRQRIATGKPGRPRLEEEQGLLIGQVIKQYAKRRVTGVQRRIGEGSQAAITAVLEATRSGTDITTAYVERLNATFRSALACLVRRGRAIARTESLLNAGMWLVGSGYNFCWYHDSLRERAPCGAPLRWDERTPAMAAGLTDHQWTMAELLAYHVPPPPWVPLKRRDGHPNNDQRHQHDPTTVEWGATLQEAWHNNACSSAMPGFDLRPLHYTVFRSM